MGLFSKFRKNKQEPASSEGEFFSRAEEESTALRSRSKRKETQSDEPVDPVLPEKKRARRRLVGAIALVLAAVIGLPMIFDTEPKPVADDIAIQIPSKDKSAKQSGNSQAVPNATDTTGDTATPGATNVTNNAPLAVSPTAATAGTVAVSALAAAPKDKVPDSTSQTAKATSTEQASAKAEVKSEAKPEIKQTPKASAKIESHKAEQKTAVVPEQKSNEAKDKKVGKFLVQVAALTTQEKINELQGKLKKAGFTVSTQKIATASGTSTRIRVGPFASKEEAEKAIAKLKKLDLNGKLVSPH
jgi:DedD protein